MLCAALFLFICDSLAFAPQRITVKIEADQPQAGETQPVTKPLWTPSEDAIAKANMTSFAHHIERESRESLPDYHSLHLFSVRQKSTFWDAIWDFCGVIGDKGSDRVLIDEDRMPGARFFPDATLNFAENLLRRRDDADAMVFRGEDKVNRRVSFHDLYNMVSRLQQALRAAGVGPGDRVAGYLPNMPETVMAMLAATSIGAVWSSASPDFGVRGVVDRFGQIDPKVLFCVDGYHYNGKSHDCLAKTAEIAGEISAITKVVVIPYVKDSPDISMVRDAVTLGDFVADFAEAEVTYERLPFDHPLYILYSSGTTGAPKCIVHRAGGVLLQHLKEHVLHCDLKRDDRIFYFTTCGWMMWNWLVTALACEATLLLYDGSPFYPDGNVLYDFAEAERMNIFGTSAKWIDACAKGGIEPVKTHDLSTVRMMTSTGSPLSPESFDYVYEKVKPDIHLASIAGGTDLVACFMLGSPLLPVWRGEIQCAGLGMETTVYDDNGQAVTGEKGELVCTGPFPSMPLGFWNDPGDTKYRAAYYEKYENIWHHGDFVEKTDHGGFIVFGRSDAVLNPGGVRIGTAEIYRQVEQLDEILEGLVIGQDWDSDVRVVLFVRLAEGITLDEALEKKVRTRIRANCTPRHVPAKIVPVADIPRTKSGKIVELAVRDVVHGREVKNKEALANPEALELFRDLDILKS